jgi:hypothetical protein
VDLHQQREEHLKEHIKKDLGLLKNYEDDLRPEVDVKQKAKLEKYIQEIKQKIAERQDELDKIPAQRRELLAREMPSVTFDELDIVTKFILGMQPDSSEINFNITNITQKISKNQLTQEVHFLLTMGMGKVKEVGRFIEVNANLRPDFPEKLKAGFSAEYQRLWTAGIKGDSLFESLHKFSCGNSSDIRKAAAGLAVLSYLFEKCEVFER